MTQRALGWVLTLAAVAGVAGAGLWVSQGEALIAAALAVAGVGLMLARAQLDGLVDVAGPIRPDPRPLLSAGRDVPRRLSRVDWSAARASLLAAILVLSAVSGVITLGPLPAADNATAASAGNQEWNFNGATVNGGVTVANGVAYFGAQDNNVYAVDTADGSVIWSFATGDTVQGAPTVKDGVVYSTSYDGSLYAINANDGSQKWAADIGTGSDKSPTLADGTIYVGAFGNDVYAINAADGSQKWIATGKGETSAVVKDGTVYVGSGSNPVINALDTADGSEQWSYSGSGSYIAAAPTLSNGVVYAGSVGGTMHAIDAGDGSEVWTFGAGGDIRTVPTVKDGSIYFGSSDNNLYALDTADGLQKWSYTAGNQIIGSPSFADGTVYFGSDDQTLYAVDAADGSEIWSFGAAGQVGAPIVADGTVYTGAGGAGVYAVGTSHTGTSSGSRNLLRTVGHTVGYGAGGQSVSGTVTDANGNPVENATVSATFYDRDEPVLIDGEDFREIVESPLPEQWDVHPDKGEVPTDESGSVDYKQFPQTADATVVLAHEGKDWGIRGYGPGNRVISLPGDQALPEPRRALAADHNTIAFSCWNPSARPGFSSDSIDSSIPNAETTPCTVHLRKLTPTGDVEFNRTLDSKAVYASRGASYFGWSEDTPTAVKHHHAVPLELEPGIYSVDAEGSAAPPTVVAVAPDRDVTQLRAENENWASNRLENITAYNEKVQAEQNNGNLSTATTTTNESGYYSLSVPDGADEADLTASKNPEQPSFDRTELTRQELTDQVESAVTTNFKAEADQSVDSLENYRQTEGIEAFKSICQQMDPIDEDVGGPYRGERNGVSVPQSGVDITGTRQLTQGIEPPLDQCAALNLLESLFDDGLAWLDAGVLDDIENMSPEEIRAQLAEILPLLNANPDLKQELEDETGITLDSDDPDDYSDDEAKQLLSEGSTLIDNPGDEDKVDRGSGNGGDGGGFFGGVDSPTDDGDSAPSVGGGDGDDTTVDPPSDDGDTGGGSNDNETDGFISKEWRVVNVDDWDEAELLVQLDWSNGSTTTLNDSSEYVSIDQRTARPDRVLLEEYPWPDNGPESVEASLSVADNSGVDSSPGSGTPNPTFDGDVPTPNHIRLSTSAPNSDQNVTVSVAGGEGFGQLADLNATGPDGLATTAEIVDNETARFRTNGTGTHRLELTLENPGGVQFTEVIRLRASSVQQPRPPTLKTSVGPTGRYPILSNGLTEGEVTVSEGGGQVEVAVTAPEKPDRVAIHTTDADVASDATHTVEVRTGADQQQVQESVGVILHQPKLSEESLWYRNGDALPNGEQSPNGQVRHENGSSVVDTFTDGNGEVEIRSIDDPGPLDRARHWADLTLPDVSFLAGLLPTPDSPAFPAVPLAGVVALPAGVLAGRRWSR